MKQKTGISAIMFMLISAIFSSVAQILFKFAANNTKDVLSFIYNPYLYFGGFSLLIGLVFMLKSLRRGELTVVYPVIATSFIWVSLLSPIFFKTDFMTLQKWIGIFIIISGVYLVSKGRER